MNLSDQTQADLKTICDALDQRIYELDCGTDTPDALAIPEMECDSDEARGLRALRVSAEGMLGGCVSGSAGVA